MSASLICANRKAISIIFSHFHRLNRLSVLKKLTVNKMYSDISNSEVETLATNPFFKKYSEKIEAFQKAAPEEFQSRLQETKRKPTPANASNRYIERPFSETGIPKPNLTQSFTAQKALDSVMKLDLIKNKTSKEITEIWKQFHLSQDKISTVIPANIYAKIFKRAKEFPIFLFPVPKSQGYEFIVAVLENHSCHFTSLVNYQAYNEDAPECLTIFHYPELMQEKEIVLMHGEYDKNTLNATEAQCLANQLQLYYTSPQGSRKHQLLEAFTHHPDSFKHMELIAELENLNLGET